VRQG